MDRKRIIALIASACLYAYAAAADDSNPPAPKPPQVTMNLRLPEPISDRQQKRCAAMLDMTEPQVEVLERFFGDYRAAYDDLEVKLIAPLKNQGAKVTAFRVRSPEYGGEYEQLMKDREAVVREQVVLETQLWSNLLPVLSKAQAERMPAVQLDRERQRLEYVYDTAELPESRVDLPRLVEDSISADAEEWRQLDEIVFAYNELVVPVLRNKSQDYLQLFRKDSELLRQLGDADAIAPTQADQAAQMKAEFVLERKRLWAQQLELSRRLKQTNIVFLTRFQQAMPTEASERLRGKFLQRGYPEIYPDTSWAVSWLRRVQAMETINDEQRVVLAALQTGYEAAYSRICGRMEDRMTEWHEKMAEHGLVISTEVQLRDKDVKAMREERSELSAKLVKAATELLTPEQRESMPKVQQPPPLHGANRQR